LGAIWLLCGGVVWAQDGDSATPELPQEGETAEPPEVGAETDTTQPAASEPPEVGADAGETEAAPSLESAPVSSEEAARARLATDQRLREIGNQVDSLKEETFATKSRLLLLRESVLRRSVAGSKLVVVHKNEMGSEYELVQVLYALDREPKYSKLDYTGSLDSSERVVVVDESVVPGSHILLSHMVFKGRPWGIFRYMDGYTFTIESSFAFTAEEGKAHLVLVRAYEGGGFFTPIEERPTVRYEFSTQALDSAEALSALNE
jgi:hypothetical protein